MFYCCTSLQHIDLSKITEIGDNAFGECTGLKTVTLPKNKVNALKIKEAICKQTRKTAGNGKNNTIKFINDPNPATQKK